MDKFGIDLTKSKNAQTKLTFVNYQKIRFNIILTSPKT